VEKLRNQLNKEIGNRQLLEIKEKQLIERNDELQKQISKTNEDLMNERKEVQTEFKRKMDLYQQKYDYRVTFEQKEKENIKSELESEISDTNKIVSDLHNKLAGESAKIMSLTRENSKMRESVIDFNEIRRENSEIKETLNKYKEELRQIYQVKIAKLKKELSNMAKNGKGKTKKDSRFSIQGIIERKREKRDIQAVKKEISEVQKNLKKLE
jgi:hypothetical protein